MGDIGGLLKRIHDEFKSSEEKLKSFQEQQVDAYHARLKRQERLEQIFVELQDVWRPRLEALAKEFGDRLQVAPTVKPGLRQAEMHVKSELASIKLLLTAGGNSDVTALVMAYDLEILPMLMQIDRHSEIEIPLEEVNADKIAAWLDDRLVSFVKTYLSLHENQYYLKDLMVSDPVAQVRFPKFAAVAKRDRKGETFYFISEETAAEFDKQV